MKSHIQNLRLRLENMRSHLRKVSTRKSLKSTQVSSLTSSRILQEHQEALGWSKRMISTRDHKTKEEIEVEGIVVYKSPPRTVESTRSVNIDKRMVFSFSDSQYYGRRIKMASLGLDVGTKTIVLAFRDDEGETRYISEINGYWPFERATPFIENMLADGSRVRADGTKRPARWIKLPETDKIVVLGRDAEEFAYAKNDTLLRPMAEGSIASDEEAMTILASIIHGMLEMAEHEIGKFDKDIKICYCTTAPALNKDINIDYHERVVDIIIQGYPSLANKTLNHIKESHAIVLNMSPDATGIGISWGAGTVTVSYIKYGLEIYSFCWVGAGDWIDKQVAMRYGYDPEALKTRKKLSKETPTTVARRKTQIDLTPGKEPTDRLGLDIVLHYDVLISHVISGIIQGFVDNESQAKIDEGINVYMAGGTSSPVGFELRVKDAFEKNDLPFAINDILKATDPLFCVAEGCLKAAEIF